MDIFSWRLLGTVKIGEEMFTIPMQQNCLDDLRSPVHHNDTWLRPMWFKNSLTNTTGNNHSKRCKKRTVRDQQKYPMTSPQFNNIGEHIVDRSGLIRQWSVDYSPNTMKTNVSRQDERRKLSWLILRYRNFFLCLTEHHKLETYGDCRKQLH
jgi:hypothetical protein